MDWRIAVVIGIIEGLTEFLPVSSTGHMIIAGHMLDFTGPKAQTFEIVIQLGAILAVTVIYRQRIARLVRAALPRAKTRGEEGMNGLHILLAICPALFLAWLLQDFIKGTLFSPETVVIGLVLGGIFMIAAERGGTKPTAETVDHITYKQAAMIGFAQILSLWPGFSRSGATIAGGMMAGASRAAAADFTFIIAIPVMALAAGYELLQSFTLYSLQDIPALAAGFAASFAVALIAVFSFIRFVQRISLTWFSWYRFVLAGAVIGYLVLAGF